MQSIVVITVSRPRDRGAGRLARIGFDRVDGAVTTSSECWRKHLSSPPPRRRLPASDLAQWRDEITDLQIVDVRNPTEQESGLIDGARSMPLPSLLDHAGDLDPDRPTVVYCASGVRSSIAASLLRARGFASVADILGGYAAWQSSTAGRGA